MCKLPLLPKRTSGVASLSSIETLTSQSRADSRIQVLKHRRHSSSSVISLFPPSQTECQTQCWVYTEPSSWPSLHSVCFYHGDSTEALLSPGKRTPAAAAVSTASVWPGGCWERTSNPSCLLHCPCRLASQDSWCIAPSPPPQNYPLKGKCPHSRSSTGSVTHSHCTGRAPWQYLLESSVHSGIVHTQSVAVCLNKRLHTLSTAETIACCQETFIWPSFPLGKDRHTPIHTTSK